MKTEQLKLWINTPGMCEETPILKAFIPDKKKSDGAIIILPGGGYTHRAKHEGDGYAEFFAQNGITAFVNEYRVYPHMFPLPLLDSRRAVRYVRYYAEQYGLDKEKIYLMGSSAGGHLAALTSTYYKEIEYENIDDIDKESAKPNGQILCYPVIDLLSAKSGDNLLGSLKCKLGNELCPDLIADETAPKAFIWHAFDDRTVSINNSLDYAKCLRRKNVSVEVHIYAGGAHGIGLAKDDEYISDWSCRLLQWLKHNDFFLKIK